MSDKTNVVIAAFTTAQARLKLYSVLERLQMRTLYFNTDSVIFRSRPGEWVPPLGDYLGELTNELDDEDYITSFVSGGPKSYAYQTKNGKTIRKVGGFTLNYRGSQKLKLSTMCEEVCRPNEEPIFLENPHFIKRDAKTKTIHTVALKKKYTLVYEKRVVSVWISLNELKLSTESFYRVALPRQIHLKDEEDWEVGLAS